MGTLKFFTIFLIVILNLNQSLCEFRFCHYGPQKFTFSECPGGVFFPVPVDTSCAYFAKTGKLGDGKITINSDLCGSGYAEEVDITGEIKSHKFDVTKVQEIIFDGELSSGNNTDDTTNTCGAECFSEWRDPISLMSSRAGEMDNDIEPTYTYPELSVSEKASQQKLTEQLFMNLILNEGGEDDKPATSLRVGKLLEASFLVLSTYCPMPYISQTLVRKSLDAFFFFSTNGNKSVRDIGQREFHEVMDVLAQCRYFDTWDNFEIIPKECSEDPTILGGIVYGPNGERKQITVRPTVLDQLDPFIEASWQTISFVNAQCFRYNTPQFNLHHIYEVAMEALFTEFILIRWANPPKLPNPSFWNNLMGTRNFQVELQNVNSCARMAYVMNPYKKRLERPFAKTNGTDAGADSRMVNPGYQGNEEQYWDEYFTKGGFKSIVSALGGKCYESESARESDRSTAIDRCSEVESATVPP